MHRTAVAALLVAMSAQHASAATPARERCVLLNAVTIPAAAIGLPTSGARVTDARFLPAAGAGPGLVAEHCRVSAAIRPRDPAALAFQSHGGKLLVIQGLADVTVSPRSTIMWWQRLIARMGAPAVRQFARFYTVPGYGHGAGGMGVFTAAWDSLPVLDAWADAGTAPGPQTVADLNTATTGRTRPLCEYPAWPKYAGTGDLNVAGSFTCVE